MKKYIILIVYFLCYIAYSKSGDSLNKAVSKKDAPTLDFTKVKVKLKPDLIDYRHNNFIHMYDTAVIRPRRIIGDLSSQVPFLSYFGIISDYWGVKEDGVERPLHLSDLNRFSPKFTYASCISDWILGERIIYSDTLFRKFIKKLNDSNVIDYKLPDDFKVFDKKYNNDNSFFVLKLTVTRDFGVYQLVYRVKKGQIFRKGIKELFKLEMANLKPHPVIAGEIYDKVEVEKVLKRQKFSIIRHSYSNMYTRSLLQR